MGLFDKKICDICGSKIGLLGNKKLEDGNMCKDCQKKLSPWFSDRRHTTVAEIKEQLAYRKANEAKVADFIATRIFGTATKLLVDEGAGRFLVSHSDRWKENNPDVLELSQLTGYKAALTRTQLEEKTRDQQGKTVSYDPPRYKYTYMFRVTLNVSQPFFDEMSFEPFPTIREDSVSVNGKTCVRHQEEYSKAKAAFDAMKEFLDGFCPCLSSTEPSEEEAPEETAAAGSGRIDTYLKSFVFPALPQNKAEMLGLPGVSLHNPYAVAAMAVAAFCRFPENPDAAIEMVNVLKGPQPLSNSDRNFIRDRFSDGKIYVPRSYFEGAVPANDYKPDEPFTIQIEESAHSRDNFDQGYLTVYLRSGGADNPRPITLRHKPSTDEWFLWNFVGILADIRIPVSADPWA